MTDLRTRCKEFLDQQTRRAITRTGSPVDDLVAFVVAETGRAAVPLLDHALPLCCYFVSEQDRDEFIAAVREAKPNMVTRKLP